MSTRLPPLMTYNQVNLRQASKAIRRNLTPDLLPKKYVEQNASNPMFGHCHTASGCLYRLFGSQRLHLYRALDRDGIWHWWIQERDGSVIDLTAEQYPSSYVKKLYKNGQKSTMLGFAYRKRVLELLRRVKIDLKL